MSSLTAVKPAVTRKSGLTLIQSQLVAQMSDFSPPTTTNSYHPDPPAAEVTRGAVETFLDDNKDFLEDYVERKVARSKLEKWLFRPYRKESLTLSYTDHLKKRQRSRSFTPLRKLSASKFEESGLSTPILVTDVDGQPSFLRTTPKSSLVVSRTLTKNYNNNISNGHVVVNNSPRLLSRPNCERNQSLYHILEGIVSETEISGLVTSVCQGLKRLLKFHHFSMLITDASRTFTGDLHVLDQLGTYSKSRASAEWLMTGAMTSRQLVNVHKPELKLNGQAADACIIAPLISPRDGRVMGAVQLARSGGLMPNAAFTAEDENLLSLVIRFTSIGLSHVLDKTEMRLELTRSEVFLELAQTVFSEQSRIEPTIKTILANFLVMIECERCQILLCSPEEPRVFQRVFDLQRSDLDEDGLVKDDLVFEGRFPINAEITGEVAATGVKINMPVPSAEDRGFDKTRARSLLCLPIHNSDEKHRVLGVISLINKENESNFSENDERFAEAFALFCGMAIRNAADFERTILSEAKLQVIFDIMNYQASSSEEEAQELVNVDIPSAQTLRIDTFEYNYIGLADLETYRSTIRMFIDLGLLSRFNIDYHTFCRWVLTVKKNYRNDTVQYHNWYHGFNVCQMMFCMLRKAGWDRVFSKIDCLGLMIGCLNHDLDHRGTTNAFQIKSKNPLATLYSSSTLERHHLNQCLLLLNIPGNTILEHLLEDEYSAVLSVIERCILATDLAQHFKSFGQVHDLALVAKKCLNLADNESHRVQVQGLMMTAADLGASTKPWHVHQHVSHLVAEEFWAQGDLERQAFDERPPPMMDRSASLALVQIDFLDNVCKPLYEDMVRFNEVFQPLLQGCLDNKRHWQRLQDHQEEEDRGHDRGRQPTKARNL